MKSYLCSLLRICTATASCFLRSLLRICTATASCFLRSLSRIYTATASCFLPYPLFSVSLVCMWLILNGFTPGQLLLAFIIAITGGMTVRVLEPEKVSLRRWWLIPLLLGRVLIDITKSNIATAWIILTGGQRKAQSGFLLLPLEVKSRTAIALLGVILTATPGTAWIAYGTKRNEILLHVLDLHNEEAWRRLIKNRYETLLKEIFE